MTIAEQAHLVCSAHAQNPPRRCKRKARYVVRSWEPRTRLECMPDYCATHAQQAQRWCLQRGEDTTQIWRVRN